MPKNATKSRSGLLRILRMLAMTGFWRFSRHLKAAMMGFFKKNYKIMQFFQKKFIKLCKFFKKSDIIQKSFKTETKFLKEIQCKMNFLA